MPLTINLPKLKKSAQKAAGYKVHFSAKGNKLEVVLEAFGERQEPEIKLPKPKSEKCVFCQDAKSMTEFEGNLAAKVIKSQKEATP